LAVAPIAREDFWHFGGVSRTLGVTFLRPCPLGEVIVCVGEVVQVGRLLGALFLLLGGDRLAD
jgi:acyl-coenzyme A thioesterase 13